MTIYCDENTFGDICYYTKSIAKIIRQYDFLINSFILEYYIDDVWNKLPLSWANFLENLTPENLAQLLKGEHIKTNQVIPLSLSCYIKCGRLFQIRRKSLEIQELESIAKRISDHETPEKLEWDDLNDMALKYVYTRHVKPKKRHEIGRFATLLRKIFSPDQVKLIDFGAGQGHLSRFLALHYGFQVMTLESEEHNSTRASSHDNQALKAIKRRDKLAQQFVTPEHINFWVTKDNFDELTLDADTRKKKTVLIGLHSCGDLSADMITLFKENQAKYLFLCSCCYNKMKSVRCPLSKMVKQMEIGITYEFKEMACHAQENYIERLTNDIDHLKIHCYRALLEKLIAEYYPSYRKSEMAKVRRFNKLSFIEYALSATRNLPIQFTSEQLDSDKVRYHVSKYMKVVTFYTLRLHLAPLLESFINLDRMVYLFEQERICTALIPIFDPLLSPRNFILVAKK